MPLYLLTKSVCGSYSETQAGAIMGSSTMQLMYLTVKDLLITTLIGLQNLQSGSY